MLTQNDLETLKNTGSNNNNSKKEVITSKAKRIEALDFSILRIQKVRVWIVISIGQTLVQSVPPVFLPCKIKEKKAASL